MDATLTENGDASSYSDEQARQIQQALIKRPKFSIRLRIVLIFLVTFALTCAIIIGDMIFIRKLSGQQEFLEKATDFEFEIQQARRFEKNYFLYGTNLEDALIHVHNAVTMKSNFAGKMRNIIGDQACEALTQNLDGYKKSLEKLGTYLARVKPPDPVQLTSFESEIRIFGSAISANATNAIDQERLRMHSWMNTSRIIAVTALLFILIVGTVLTGYIIHQIVRSYSRFEKYTQRIARGDFSLITPTRKYRDEFSNLAIALNHMLIELKNREEQLLQSRKMAAVGTLTAGIAHELNNPLNNISLITESLLDEFDEFSREEKLKMLRDIFTQVERAGVTVANLLDFTRRDEFAYECLNINEVLERTLSFVSNEIRVNKVKLEKELAPNLPQIQGNAHNLQQVFLNIILNAIQAMPDGGTLSVKSYIENNSIRIDIADTGTGISADNREKIFDPFFTTKAIGQGTGLGLSVSYGIVEQHHGHIQVDSELGKGSKFSIFLPPSKDNKLERGY